MRAVFVFILFFVLRLNAQDPGKTALTPGCELSDFRAEPPNSITSGYQIIDYQGYTYYRLPPVEPQLTNPPDKPIEIGNSNANNPGIFILTFLLIATGVFFITARNKNKILSDTSANLETEEDDDRKKQLWNALSEPGID